MHVLVAQSEFANVTKAANGEPTPKLAQQFVEWRVRHLASYNARMIIYVEELYISITRIFATGGQFSSEPSLLAREKDARVQFYNASFEAPVTMCFIATAWHVDKHRITFWGRCTSAYVNMQVSPYAYSGLTRNGSRCAHSHSVVAPASWHVFELSCSFETTPWWWNFYENMAYMYVCWRVVCYYYSHFILMRYFIWGLQNILHIIRKLLKRTFALILCLQKYNVYFYRSILYFIFLLFTVCVTCVTHDVKHRLSEISAILRTDNLP